MVGWWPRVEILCRTYCTCASGYRLLCFGGGHRQSLLTAKHYHSQLLSEPYRPAVPLMSVNTPVPARYLREISCRRRSSNPPNYKSPPPLITSQYSPLDLPSSTPSLVARQRHIDPSGYITNYYYYYWKNKLVNSLQCSILGKLWLNHYIQFI